MGLTARAGFLDLSYRHSTAWKNQFKRLFQRSQKAVVLGVISIYRKGK